MKEKIEKLKAAMLADLQSASDEAQIKTIEVKYFGKKGAFTEVMSGLKDLSI